MGCWWGARRESCSRKDEHIVVDVVVGAKGRALPRRLGGAADTVVDRWRAAQIYSPARSAIILPSR